MPRLLLLNDNSEQQNWGAQATPYALRKMLNDAIPNLEIVAFSFSWLRRRFRKLKTPIGSLLTERVVPGLWRLTRNAEFFPNISDEFDYFAKEWMEGRGGPMAEEFIAAARQSDVVVHNGEHSIYRNTLEGCRALFLLWFARTRLRKPACEINHTAHLAGIQERMAGMVKRVYPVLDLVTVREPCSFRNLRALGINNVILVPDVVFYIDALSRAERCVARWKENRGLKDGSYACLSASALLMSAPRNGWEGWVAKVVLRLKQIVPECVLLAKDNHCEFLKQVAVLTDSTYFGPTHDLFELWPLFRGARFLVTGHYHYAIMAAMVGCPFVPMSTNSHKMRGICEHLDWHLTTPFDATALANESDGLVEETRSLVSNYEQFSQHLLARSARMRGEAFRNAELVRDAMNGSIPSRRCHGSELPSRCKTVQW